MEASRAHRNVLRQDELFGMGPHPSSLIPRPDNKWDRVWGPPVEFDPRFPDGKPAVSADEWDPFFGPPVRKGQGGRRWTPGEDPRVVRPPPAQMGAPPTGHAHPSQHGAHPSQFGLPGPPSHMQPTPVHGAHALYPQQHPGAGGNPHDNRPLLHQ
jgi:hypothetical protein